MDKRDRIELMGEIVTVTKQFMRFRDGSARRWEAVVVKPRAGWVTGFRTLTNGFVDVNYGEYEYSPTKTIPCILISYWPTENPVKVPLDAFELGGEPYATSSWGNPDSKWGKESREYMREIMKDYPRNEKGQWLPFDELTPEQIEKLRESW